jgi:acyl-CoA synthetase (AMP-forming)/AMP-acid ligase II
MNDRSTHSPQDCGVAAGDRVGLWAPNRHEWVIAQFDAARIGAILVNVNPAYRAGELQFALTKPGVSVHLLDRPSGGGPFVDGKPTKGEDFMVRVWKLDE